ncbi:hypothetical protein ACQUY5_27975 [Bacillus cereus]|uniref:hypothetical protein n=1 Tax=Bacillus cereus TaxID=1396 RepID=UPI003D173ADA
MSEKQCSIEGCTDGKEVKGFCQKHYQEQYRNEKKRKRKGGLCIAEGCDKEPVRGSYCTLHFDNWVKYGRTTKIKGTQPKRLCSVDGCTRGHASKGYCQVHKYRLNKYGQLTIPNKTGSCKIEGCNDGVYAKELCNKHYQRVHRKGELSGN